MSPSTPPAPQQPPPSSGTPDSAFSRIALSLSGGGFRASTYSLGTLNALYLLGLLDNVHMLSTASGGTITGAFYALWRKQGKQFESIYKEFYEFLQRDTLLNESLRRWKANVDADKGHYKLINAFSDIYDRDLYDNTRFGVFWQPDSDANKPFHLQSIIFGATELYSGLTFRFQYASCMPETITDKRGDVRPSFLVGNGNVHIRSERARELRIADTVAASSCFPGGFEPLVLPYDFFSSDDIQPALLDANGKDIEKDRIALVDGGVYDNQGIESLLNANLRNRDYRKNSSDYSKNSLAEQNLLQPSTLLLIADVDSAGKDLYNTPLPGPTRARGTTFGQLGTVRSTAQWLLLILFVFSLFFSYQYGIGNFWAGLVAGLSAIGLLVALGIRWLWKKLTGYFKLLGLEIHALALPPVKGLSVQQLWYLLTIRLSSVLTLLSSVFLRRVRGLDYGLVFSRHNGLSPDVVVLPSIIGGIVKDFNKSHKADPLHPSVRDELAPIYETVRTASEMSTTLWWLDDKHRLKAIMASAELTLCYRLLRQFEKNPPIGPRGIELRRRATLIWAAFQVGGKCFHLHPGLLQSIEDPTTDVSQFIDQATKLNSPDLSCSLAR
ncbi:hypothetical protein GCM10028819_49710 [Spirosoma humi]